MIRKLFRKRRISRKMQYVNRYIDILGNRADESFCLDLDAARDDNALEKVLDFYIRQIKKALC